MEMDKATKLALTRTLTAGQALATILSDLAAAQDAQVQAGKVKLPQMQERLAVRSADFQQEATTVMTSKELRQAAADLLTLFTFATDVADGQVTVAPPKGNPQNN